MAWKEKMETLAEEVAAACRTAIGSEAIGVRDECETMWDAEYDPYVGPTVIIGRFNWYRVVEAYRGRLFGVNWLPHVPRSRTLATFELEEMFEVPRYTDTIVCRIDDPRVIEAVQLLVARFAERNGISPRFVPPA